MCLVASTPMKPRAAPVRKTQSTSNCARNITIRATDNKEISESGRSVPRSVSSVVHPADSLIPCIEAMYGV